MTIRRKQGLLEKAIYSVTVSVIREVDNIRFSYEVLLNKPSSPFCFLVFVTLKKLPIILQFKVSYAV